MLAKVHQDFARERLSPHFVYESYDEDTGFFFNRGSIGFVLMGNPLVGTSVQAQGEIAEFLKDEENLPSGSSLQVLMIGSDQINHFLDNWQFYRREEIFYNLAKRRTDFFRLKAKEGIVKDVVLLISVTIPAMQVDLDAMERRREILKNTFRSIGLYTENVDATIFLKFVRTIFGWRDKEEQPVLNPYEILSEQILPSDFSAFVKEDMVLLGYEEAFITLEVVKRPTDWRLALMDLFIGNELRRQDYIKSNYLIHLGVQILTNQAVAKAGAITKREALERNIAAGMGKLFPDIEHEAKDLNAAVKSLQGGDRMITLHMNVIVSCSPKKVKDVAASYCSMMRRNGFYFVPCNNDHLAVMLASLPMQLVSAEKGIIADNIGGMGVALRNLGRGIKTVSSETKALLPIIGEWKGDLTSPGMLLSGRRGQIMYWSPFGSSLMPHIKQHGSGSMEAAENYNVCVAGVSGSGKSVFLQELMWSTLGVGGKVFVLDYGRSFKHSCLLLKGNYIEFDTRYPISINPFSEIPEGNDPKSSEARADFLGSFPLVLATMAAPQYGTNDLQQPMLQQALIEVWKTNGAKAEITDIADWLMAKEESYAKELGNMLFPFTREGQYGKFFSGKAELSLNSRVVVIETDNLRNFPELMTVVTQMMMVHINRTMAKSNRDIPSLIIIDEMKKTIKSKKAGEFVDESSRIVRKYNTAIVVATQHLTDFFPLEGGPFEKIFAGSSHKVILKQNPESLTAMRSISQLAHFVKEDWKLNLMQSIHSVKHHYSEAAIFGPNIQGIVGRLMIDPFNLLLLSTDANEYQQVEQRMERGMNLTASIEDILKERGVH
ncbi:MULTISPECIES: TraC family protein [unclassified Candidatus Tisiphia]|uniref:TraC family protein n=1 Tax=unclassified Candidatus Tisiphia TaxID=2996318 RepID=UPI00312C7CCD